MSKLFHACRRTFLFDFFYHSASFWYRPKFSFFFMWTITTLGHCSSQGLPLPLLGFSNIFHGGACVSAITTITLTFNFFTSFGAALNFNTRTKTPGNATAPLVIYTSSIRVVAVSTIPMSTSKIYDPILTALLEEGEVTSCTGNTHRQCLEIPGDLACVLHPWHQANNRYTG